MPRFFIDPDITKARTPDTGFYTDPELFRQSKEKLFAASWQFIGDADLVREPGSAHPFTLLENYLDEPLVLVRDKDSILHLLSNVCTHRGNILVGEPCKISHLRCRYHGRQFHLDGQLLSMPEFREVKDFPSKADNLVSLPLFQWGKWLFTSLSASSHLPPPSSGSADIFHPPSSAIPLSSPSASESYPPSLPSFDECWQEIQARMSWLPLDKFVFRPDRSRDFTVKAHWALYCENYLEGFHIPFVHAGLNAVIDFGNYTTELFTYSNLQLGIAKDEEDCFDLPPSSPDYGKKVAAYYFYIFPNMMFNFYPWGLSINIVKPVSPQETKVSFLTYVADESKFNTGAGSGLDAVEMEDEEVVEAVQQGVKSRFYSYGRYSPTREQGTHHFHRIMAGFMG